MQDHHEGHEGKYPGSGCVPAADQPFREAGLHSIVLAQPSREATAGRLQRRRDRGGKSFGDRSFRGQNIQRACERPFVIHPRFAGPSGKVWKRNADYPNCVPFVVNSSLAPSPSILPPSSFPPRPPRLLQPVRRSFTRRLGETLLQEYPLGLFAPWRELSTVRKSLPMHREEALIRQEALGQRDWFAFELRTAENSPGSSAEEDFTQRTQGTRRPEFRRPEFREGKVAAAPWTN